MKTVPPERMAVSIKEAAEMLGCSIDTIYREIKRKNIHAVRIGRKVLIPVTEMERILREGA